MIFNNVIQIILAVIASGTITSLVLLRPKRRSSDTESYALLLDDLNTRLDIYVKENAVLRAENNQLRKDLEQLRTEVDKIRSQLSSK